MIGGVLRESYDAVDVSALEAAFASGIPKVVEAELSSVLDRIDASLRTASAFDPGIAGHVSRAVASGGASSPVCVDPIFTSEERAEALRDYVQGGELNTALRNGWSLDEADQKAVAVLDELMAMRATSEPVDLLRITPRDVFGDLRIGSEFTDAGFVSTTKSKAALNGILEQALGEDGWRGAKVFRIRVPQGVRHADVNLTLGKSHYFQSQKEIVLDRGLRYRVTGFSTMDVGDDIAMVVEVEVVGSGSRAGAVLTGAAARQADPNAHRFAWRDGDVTVTRR